MRRALWPASIGLVMAVLTGCGPPTDASVNDFCDVIDDFPTSFNQQEMEDYLNSLKDTGTPEDIPDEARDGFELSIEILEEVDFDADDQDIADDLQDRRDDLDDDEQDAVEAFDDYRAETCGEQ